jgi:hypothetical protein
MPRDPAKRHASNLRYNESDKGQAAQQRRGEKLAAGRAADKAARKGHRGRHRGGQAGRPDRSRGSRHRLRDAQERTERTEWALEKEQQ